MLRTRLIPAIVISNKRLINTKKFKEVRYLGDPLNSIRIFNEKEADEILIFDITKNNNPDFNYLRKLSNACRMPACYGGSVRNIKDAIKLVNLGFEKVSISTLYLKERSLIDEISAKIGRQSAVITLNVKQNLFRNGYQVFCHRDKRIQHKLKEIILDLKKREFGELIINCEHKDGTRDGYDEELIKYIYSELADKFIITFCGGAKDMNEIIYLSKIYPRAGFSATSCFVYSGKLDAVLINYNNPFRND